MKVFLLILGLLKYSSCQLQFTQTSLYTRLWSSSLESSQDAVSLWKPALVDGFHLLGDVAVLGSGRPSRAALLVRSENPEDLAAPLSSTKEWSNQGSSSGHQVSVYQLSAPYGYRCLGMVAVVGYVELPDLSKYRCVKKDYVVAGSPRVIWDDTATSIYIRGHLDLIEPASGDTLGGLNTQHFAVDTSGTRHQVQVWVLLTQYLAPASDNSSTEDAANSLSVKKSGPGQTIWQEPRQNVAIFSPTLDYSSFYRAGSYLGRPDRPSGGYLVAGNFGTALEWPLNYTLLMGDTTQPPLYLWQPVCPDGFLNIGIYATSTPDKPEDETVCVHERFISEEYHSWSFARTDDNYQDTLWEAAASPSSLTMRSFTYTSFAGDYPSQPPSLLDPSRVKRVTQQSIVEYRLKDLQFADTYSVVSSKRLVTADDSTDPFSLVVSGKWSLEMETQPGVPVKIVVTPGPAGEGYNDVIAAAAEHARMLDTYFTFEFVGTEDRAAGGDTVQEYWVDVGFTAVLVPVKSEQGRRTSVQRAAGTLNLRITETPTDV